MKMLRDDPQLPDGIEEPDSTVNFMFTVTSVGGTGNGRSDNRFGDGGGRSAASGAAKSGHQLG